MIAFPMLLRRVCAIVLLTPAVLHVPARAQGMQLLPGHVRSEVARGHAQLLGALEPERRIQLSLVLPLRNPAELNSVLRQIYDPAGPQYRQFLSAQQFAQRFSPSPADYRAVSEFARENGFDVGRDMPNRLVVPISGTVTQIESAFHVRMNLYRAAAGDRVFFSPDREPTIDRPLPLAHIAGLNDFSLPVPLVRRLDGTTRPHSQALTGSGPAGSYVAADMRAAYYGETSLTGAGQTVALVEFDGYRRSDVDLTLAASGQSSSVVIQNVLLDGVDGTPAHGDDAEPVLDIVQAIGMAPGLSAVRVYIGNSDVDILNAIAAENVAQQIAISWTWSPNDPAVDDEFFLEMAAQGQSVIAASGDHGEFDPLMLNFYPAEDAWVTAVGGTHLLTSGPGGAWSGESAWLYSGGGISPGGIPLPWWQAGTANAANGGSNTLRNVPDVAMESDFDNYLCVMGVCSGGWGGTSFAAARWAGFVALANEQTSASGAPPIGFLNPGLYTIAQNPQVRPPLHDVVSGDNNAENGCCGQPYFSAVAGYDLVTGWGTPAGRALIDAIASPSAPTAQIRISPSILSLAPGASGSIAIAISSQSPVSLSVSGLPPGVTPSFSANPAETASVLTLIIDKTALRGDSLLFITGKAGDTTASAQLALHIEAPGFTLTPTSTSVILYPGASASDSMVVTSFAGFSAPVHFAVTSELPAGVRASWLNSPSSTAAELTLTADSSVAPVRTMLTITGIAGAVTATATVALAINPAQVVLNLSPYPLELGQGESVQSAISVIPIGAFSGAIDLSAPQLPQGVTASINPVTTSAAAVLSLTAALAAPPGASPVEIAGKGGDYSTGAQFTQTILTKGTPHFALAATPAFTRLTRGGSITLSISVIPAGGFSGPVTLRVADLPSGVTAAWSANPATGSTTLTLRADSDAPATVAQPLQIEGTSGALASSALVYVTIEPAAGFALVPSPAELLLPAGGTAAATLSVVGQAGFNAPVTVSLQSILPEGVSADLTSQPGGAAIHLSAEGSCAASAFLLIAAGTSGAQTATASIPVRIVPLSATPPKISALSPAFVSANAPSFSLTVNGSRFTSGSVVYWNQHARSTRYASPTQLIAQLDPTDTAQPGIAAISVLQPNAGGVFSNTLQFEIDSGQSGDVAPTFAVDSATVPAGRIAVYPVSFSSGVTPTAVACLNLPAGATCAWSAASSAINITTAANSPKGTFAVTVVFTETQSTVLPSGILLPFALFPLALFRRSGSRRRLRIFYVVCLGVILAGFIAACANVNGSRGPSPTAGSAGTLTSSGVVSLTIK
jgi:hypothetical protein